MRSPTLLVALILGLGIAPLHAQLLVSSSMTTETASTGGSTDDGMNDVNGPYDSETGTSTPGMVHATSAYTSFTASSTSVAAFTTTLTPQQLTAVSGEVVNVSSVPPDGYAFGDSESVYTLQFSVKTTSTFVLSLGLSTLATFELTGDDVSIGGSSELNGNQVITLYSGGSYQLNFDELASTDTLTYSEDPGSDYSYLSATSNFSLTLNPAGIPEPSILGMMLCGLSLFAAFACRSSFAPPNISERPLIA